MSAYLTEVEIATLLAHIVVLRSRQNAVTAFYDPLLIREHSLISAQIEYIHGHINSVRALRDDAQDKLRAIADGPHDDELCEKGTGDPADESCAPCFAAHLLNRIHDEELNALAEFKATFPGVIP